MSTAPPWIERASQALGQPIVRAAPLAGGCVGDVYRAEVERAGPVVVKIDDDAPAEGDAALAIEGRMLRDLRAWSTLPVPGVLHASPRLLIMEFVGTEPVVDRPAVERSAADHLAALHARRPHESGSQLAYGLGYDTLIGGLHQPNTSSADWPAFFAEHRLRAMARQAVGAGRVPARTAERIDRLADRIDDLLRPPDGRPRTPGLIHGDVWSGNVLAARDRVAAFIDPAIYVADPEIELAFITMFSTFGRDFFDRYAAQRPEWAPWTASFWSTRRHVYNLYPLLVHARLFGGGYAAEVNSALDALGV